MSTNSSMERLTCIIDALTLVDNVHQVKQWVYSDLIHLHIPLCTSDKVEQLYKASLAPKEVQKEPPTKKPLSKAMRKEIPLFDINPRATMEFLERARAGADSHSVTFQQTQEQFTQWKEEEQQATKAEQAPEGPPTSFAQALLRKLNFQDGSDANGTKGPSKPRLVARSTSPKSPWKYHKVPTISTDGVSAALKPLFSCMLWRLHEFENNPLMPDTFVLLSNDYDTRALAQKLNVPTKSTAELRKLIKQVQSNEDRRATIGEVEKEFNLRQLEEGKLDKGSAQVDEKSSLSPDGFDSRVEPVLEQDEEVEGLKKTVSNENVLSNGAAQAFDLPIDASTKENCNTKDSGDNPGPSVASPSPQTVPGSHEDTPVGSQVETTPTSGRDTSVAQEPMTPPPSPPTATRSAHNKESGKPAPESPVPTAKNQKDTASTSDESDDEEVIVFKPRSRRTSGLPKSAGDSSRPSTADGARRPLDADPSKKLNIPQVSTPLKPQSPVFVPRSLHPTGKHQSQLSVEPIVNIPDQAPVETAVQPEDQAQPVIPQQRRTSALHTRRSEGLAQRQSRDIIERQREAIQRQTQVQAKPAPRQIQMEPTSSPTVIDPDAFDRSYVVQPRNAATVNGTNGNHRTPHPRGSPRRSPRTPEPEVDFVLKSGSPRAAVRGKGKLWVP